jgi:hypothetical protein
MVGLAISGASFATLIDTGLNGSEGVLHFRGRGRLEMSYLRSIEQ